MAERVVKVKLIAAVSDYEKGMIAAADATRTVGAEAEKLEQKRRAFEQVGQGLVLTGAALTAVTALSVKAALDWESAWAGVTKTVDGNAEEMGALEDGLRSLARTLPATHQEIAAVAEAAGQLGVARESVVDFTKVMIDLSETTNLTADEAATSIAQLMNVMQTAPDDVDNLGAALVALGNDGASTERDIIQMAQRIAGAGKTVGLTEAQVLAFANALASVGIEAEAGGSAISRVMTDIAMSVSAGGEKLDQFAAVAGMSSESFQKAFKDDPANAITTFIEGLGRINAKGGDVFKTLSDLGQSDIRVSQALLGMANSGDLLRESLDLGSRSWEENNALAAEAAKRYETTEAKIQIAGNAVRDAAIDFGEVFLPAVGAAADGVAQFASFLGDLPDPVQGIVGVITSVVGVIALTGGTALLAIPKIVEFKTALDTLGISMRTVSLAGGGIVLALTALVAVVGSVATAQAEAEAKAKSYADTLAEGTQKVTDATRELIAENINAQQGGFFGLGSTSMADAAKDLGISLDTVRKAIEGNADALDEVNSKTQAAIDGYNFWDQKSIELNSSAEFLRETIEEETGALDQAAQKARDKAEATSESADAADDAADAYLAEADAVDDLSSQLGSLIDRINAANGVAQDAITANARYQSALEGLSEQVEKNGTSLDENTAAGSANAAALSDVAQAAQVAAEAQFQQDLATMSADDAAKKWNETLAAQKQAFIDSAVSAGYNADQVRALADRIFQMPDKKQVAVLVETAAAQSQIDKFITLNNGKRVKVFVDAQGGESFRVGSTTVSANEDGGLYSYRAFADGGLASGIYPGGANIHKFAEESLPWEAYISPKADQRARNYGVWQEVGERLNFMQPQSSGPVQVSLAGAEFTMLVDGRPVRAIVQEQVVEQSRQVTSGIRNRRRADA